MRPSDLRERVHGGFTFLEITYVTAVISILAAILFPVFAQVTKKASTSTCEAHLSGLGLALQLYAHDADGRYPPGDNDWRPLVPYLSDPQPLLCPDDGMLQAVRREGVGRWSSYCYRGGLRSDDRGNIPIAADWEARHQGGVAVLFLSGAVRWFRKPGPVANGPRPVGTGTDWVTADVPIPCLNDPPPPPVAKGAAP